MNFTHHTTNLLGFINIYNCDSEFITFMIRIKITVQLMFKGFSSLLYANIIIVTYSLVIFTKGNGIMH